MAHIFLSGLFLSKTVKKKHVPPSIFLVPFSHADLSNNKNARTHTQTHVNIFRERPNSRGGITDFFVSTRVAFPPFLFGLAGFRLLTAACGQPKNRRSSEKKRHEEQEKGGSSGYHAG